MAVVALYKVVISTNMFQMVPLSTSKTILEAVQKLYRNCTPTGTLQSSCIYIARLESYRKINFMILGVAFTITKFI